MNPVSEVVKDLLVVEGFGVFASESAQWSIATNSEPPKPNNMITIYDYAGENPMFFLNKDLEPVEKPHFQIRVRSASYLTGNEKINAINDYLKKVDRFTADGIRYEGFIQTSSVFFLTRDDNNRPIWVSSYKAILRQ